MKWIGQHIVDLIARFRGAVYLEDVSTGTIASGGNLGLDSNNKIVKATVSGGISHDGSTADGVLTYKDADEATVEQYLTFLNNSNISALSLLSNQDTGDYFSLATTTHGATTLTTVDDDATAAHFEVAADGNIILDSAANVYLETVDSGFIYLKNGANTFANFYAESGNISGLTMYEMGGDSTNDYFSIQVEEHGETTIQTIDAAAAAANLTISADGTFEAIGTTVTLDSSVGINLEIANDEYINLKNGSNTFAQFGAESGAGSEFALFEQGGDSTDDYFRIDVLQHGATTIATHDEAGGAANLGFSIDGQFSVASTGIDIAANGTITNAVWNGTKITDIYTNSSGKRFGNTIKILPSDFIANDEGSIGVAFDDDSNTGMVLEDTNSEMWAFVTIPEGMKATAVNIYSNNSARNFYVYEMDIDANGLGSSLGNNTLNTAVTGLSVNATATNFLAIKLDLSATNQRIRGGLVTIAAQ